MKSTMMSGALNLSHFLERAGRLFAGREIVSRLPDASLLVAAVFCGALGWWTVVCLGSVALRTTFTTKGLLWLNRGSGAVIMGFGLAALMSLLALPWRQIGHTIGLD